MKAAATRTRQRTSHVKTIAVDADLFRQLLRRLQEHNQIDGDGYSMYPWWRLERKLRTVYDQQARGCR